MLRGSQCVGGKALVRSVFQDVRLESGVELILTMQQDEAETARGLEPASSRSRLTAWLASHGSCCRAPWVLFVNPGLTRLMAPGNHPINAFEGETERETTS